MTISTERLESIKGKLSGFIDHHDIANPTIDEAIAMIDELLAVREAQPVDVTDEMAMAFHRALTDSDIGSDDLDDIKIGLRGALCNHMAPPAPAVPDAYALVAEAWRLMDGQNSATSEWHSAASSYLNACRAAMLQPVSQGYTLNSPAIPDGHRMVPVELLERLLADAHAASSEFSTMESEGEDQNYLDSVKSIIDADTAAAPTPTK